MKRQKNIIRESNFELLRIVSMALIVLYHIIYHGNMLNNSTNYGVTIILKLILFATIIHVNSFALVSGYFQCTGKFKLKKMISLIIEIIFYSGTIYLLAVKFGFIEHYSYLDLINNFSITIISKYWFMKSYLVLYIFSDFINSFIHSLSKKSLERFIMIGFVIFSILPIATGGALMPNDGYNFYHLAYLYVVGAYLRLYPIKDSYHFKNMSINKYRLLLVLGFFFCVYLNYTLVLFAGDLSNSNLLFKQLANRVFQYSLSYSVPFTVIQTVCYFEFFKSFKFKSKFINFVSRYTFGVYLIHDNPTVRQYIYKFLKIDVVFSDWRMIFYTFLIMVLIFVVCIFIDILRDKLFKTIGHFTSFVIKYIPLINKEKSESN